MTKGKFGLNLAAVAILTFVLAFFGFLEALVLLVAYALLIEKNQWLTRQTLQALYLKLIYNVVVTVVGWAFTLLEKFFGLFKASGIVNALFNINTFINTLLYICLFLLCALAVTRLLKEQDADIPLAANLSDYTMGKVEGLVPPAAPAATAYQAPAAAAPVSSRPAPAQEPAAEAVQQSTAADCVDADAEQADQATGGTWKCGTCGRKNTGNFCIGCGNNRPS
jgi:hypothetical protein